MELTILLPSLVAKYAKLIVPSQKDSTTFKRYLCAQSKKHDMLEIRFQAGLISHQEHVTEKQCTYQNQANKTQNSHLKYCIFWGLGDCHPHPIQCMTAIMSAEAASPVILML
jgi:hypothetical protein